ncbi:MAG: membrane integrity-associated transporter subunit PqiC [Betaproteobacteria bacterium]|jgi:cholesterol transport system auxiliary component|nr:membrane integrity-associated transporter subunit PqiC [Betaproteobacteria bacterium]
MKKTLLLAALLLAGCGSGSKSLSSVAYYDLGAVQPAPNNRIVASLRSIDVFAVSWLDSSAMQYRLLYAANQRRQNFAESRWVAPPAELIGHALRKRMLSGEAGGACRLRVDLDEFAQVFDSASTSRVVLDARVQLVEPTGSEILARRSFSLSRPAASADAGSGAAALTGAVEAFSTELHDWLGGLDRAAASRLNIAQRCRS